jgi:hypothetical protein
MDEIQHYPPNLGFRKVEILFKLTVLGEKQLDKSHRSTSGSCGPMKCARTSWFSRCSLLVPSLAQNIGFGSLVQDDLQMISLFFHLTATGHDENAGLALLGASM